MRISSTAALVGLALVLAGTGSAGAQMALPLPPAAIPAAGEDFRGPQSGGLPATAADAALALATRLDGAGGGISTSDQISALQDAAAAGQPMALYQLGLMYETGEGVDRDPVKAFSYFSRIANEHADAAPRGVEADIVAQSFVKVGEYYHSGLPGAGISPDTRRSQAMIMHAATYFGDADAQYRLGQMYLNSSELGFNPLQSARWLSLAARKGHGPAQATLGDLLFNGEEGLASQPEEGLMWLTMASKRVAGTPDEGWVNELLNADMSLATPEQRARAMEMAESLGSRFGAL